MANIFTDTQISEFTSGMKNNPLYQQAQIQLGNQPFLAGEARAAYDKMMGQPVPEQEVAAFDPTRMAGINQQLGLTNVGGILPTFLQQGLTAAGNLQGGIGTAQNTLQNIAGGAGPQFSNAMASGYQNFMQPSLMSAQQALANQANLAWNKGVGSIGGMGGGFMNSGRQSALGQAAENAATTLGNQQQMLALQAAQQAAQAGQQAGTVGSQQRLLAGEMLGKQGLGALQLQNNLASGMLLPGQTQEAAGATKQQQEQNELNAAFMNELAKTQNPFKALQNLQAGLGVLGSSNYAPNMPMPNNTMALLNMLGLSVPGLVQGGFNWLKDYLGNDANGQGIPPGGVKLVGEAGPEIVNGQLLPRPTLVQGPATVQPVDSIGADRYASAWSDF